MSMNSYEKNQKYHLLVFFERLNLHSGRRNPNAELMFGDIYNIIGN